MSGLSKRQLSLRREGIGASEIAALAGCSRWATPIEIFESKLDLNPEKVVTLAMRLGNEFEEPISKIYAEDTGRWLRTVDTLQHPTSLIALATPDRAAWAVRQPELSKRKKLTRGEIQGCEKLVQIKSTNWRLKHEWGPAGTDQIAEHYLVQGQWEMGVSGVHRLDFGVLFDKDEFRIYPLVFSEEIFAMLLEVAERFMADHVRPGIPPPIDYTEKYADYLARTFPGKFYEKKAPLDLVTADEAQVADVLLYAKLKEAGKRLEQHLGLVTNRLKAAIGERAGITHPDFGTLTWKRTKDSTTTDWQKVARETRNLAGLALSGDVPLTAAQRADLIQQLKGVEAAATAPRPGFRRFYSQWQARALIELSALNLSLERLEESKAGESKLEEEVPW